MQYALLIFLKPDSYDGFSDTDRQAITAEYMAIAGEDRVLGARTCGRRRRPRRSGRTGTGS